MSENQIFLAPWDHAMHYFSNHLSRDVRLVWNVDVNLYGMNSDASMVAGYYACYLEGIFCVFYFENILYMYFDGNLIAFDEIKSISWKSDIYGRRIEIFMNNHSYFKFDYQSLKAFMINPIRFFIDVVFASDWFGLTSDLPSAIHSFFIKKDIHPFLNGINKENDRRGFVVIEQLADKKSDNKKPGSE